MEYTLHREAKRLPLAANDTPRLVTSRPSNLRRGGGRRDSAGWTEQKRRTNRRRFDQLRPHLKTCVTIWYPSQATPEQLAAFSRLNREFCKENLIPARAVWEGPGKHLHLALGLLHDLAVKAKWRRRLSKAWKREFHAEMPQDAFLWKPNVEPEKIASYLSKTRKNGLMIKRAWPWLSFNPVWEVGLRIACKVGKPVRPTSTKPRKTRGKSSAVETSENEGEMGLRQYSSGNEGESEGLICSVCWPRWGRSLWAGSCKCTGDVR